MLFRSLGSTGYKLSLRHWQPAVGTIALDMRDIVIVHSDDGGQTWSPKRRVNHDPAGSDQAMPNIAVDERGRVYVAWYDWRDVVDGDGMNAYAATSNDGGITFGPDLRLSSVSSRLLDTRSPNGFFRAGDMVGDRIALAAGDNYGIVAWTDLRTGLRVRMSTRRASSTCRRRPMRCRTSRRNRWRVACACAGSSTTRAA